MDWGWTVTVALLIGAALALPASASDRHDHQQAWEARQAGQILPLGTVLERLAREQAGQVLEVELERDKGQWLYEVKLLQASGRVLTVKVDAATGLVQPRHARPNESR